MKGKTIYELSLCALQENKLPIYKKKNFSKYTLLFLSPY